MNVDISKIKVGDTVAAEFVVSLVSCGRVYIKSDQSRKLELMRVVGHTPAPRPIKAGDTVHAEHPKSADPIKYRVVAVESDSAWLCGETGRYWTAPLSTLEHADV